MGEKSKRIPTTREQRRPLLDAAKAGKADLIDKALIGLLEGHMEDIRTLISREWGTLLQDRIPGEGRTKAALLTERLDSAQKALTSTHAAVAQASEVIIPQTPVKPPAEVDGDKALLAKLEAQAAALRAKLGERNPSAQPPAQAPASPQPTAPTPPPTHRQPHESPGPARGTRVEPYAKPNQQRVAEGRR